MVLDHESLDHPERFVRKQPEPRFYNPAAVYNPSRPACRRYAWIDEPEGTHHDDTLIRE